MPTPFGESIVLRLLEQSSALTTLEKAGLREPLLNQVRELFRKPNGIILVTGPTGSGKSTTLYAAINEIHRSEIKIITIEDPIEYFLPWAVQIQTNDKIDLTFSSILRGILRHDPDVILLGEMRDKESSSIAMRTALTGRLVLSTLHTNDAISAVYRLIDLGVEPYMIAASARAIIAQRLVRLICKHCIEDDDLDDREKIWLSHQNFSVEGKFKRGKGCPLCRNTGYQGRTAIFEVLELDTHMTEALRKNDQQAFHQHAQHSILGNELVHSGYDLALKGLTSMSEIMRIVNEAISCAS